MWNNFDLPAAAERNKKWGKGGRRGGGVVGLKITLDIPYFFRPPLLQEAIKGGLYRSSRRLLELSNMHAPSFVRTFALANILAISTGSIMSANVFWQWTSMQPFNRSYIIVFVRYVLRRLKAGKLLSEVRDSYFFNNGGWSRIQQN